MSAERGRPAVFLDRDGVLNESAVRDGVPVPPSTVAEFRLLAGVAEACARLRAAGYVLVVVTNQPDVARGTQSRRTVERMHDVLSREVRLDDIRVCFHDDADDCSCRKPRPGLVLGAATDLQLDLSRSFLVGDRWRDVECARRAGVRAIHVHRHAEKEPNRADTVVADLPSAVDHILAPVDSQGVASD